MSPTSLAAAGFGMYGGKFLNDGASFMSSNYAKYFSTASMRAYFDVGVVRVSQVALDFVSVFAQRVLGSFAGDRGRRDGV